MKLYSPFPVLNQELKFYVVMFPDFIEKWSNIFYPTEEIKQGNVNVDNMSPLSMSETLKCNYKIYQCTYYFILIITQTRF